MKRRTQNPSVQSYMGDLRADYDAMRSNAFRSMKVGLAPGGSGADWNFRHESQVYTLIEYARHMSANVALVRAGIERSVDNVIQTGFGVDPQTGDAEIDAILSERWAAWANDPLMVDPSGRRKFSDLERLAYRSMTVDGDVFFMGLDTGALEVVEAHRVKTPKNALRSNKNIVLGVAMNEDRRPEKLYITKDHIALSARVEKVGDTFQRAFFDDSGERVIAHVSNWDRVSQTRGISKLAVAFDYASMMDDTLFATLVRAQAASSFVFMEEWTEANAGLTKMKLGSEDSSGSLDDGSIVSVEDLAPGTVLKVPKGKSLKPWAPGAPSPDFMAHMRHLLQMLGMSLGVPLVLLLMDGSETNFSGWRGALEQAKLGFIANQEQIKTQFHDWVWRFKVRGWIAEDSRLASFFNREGAAIYKARWNAPRWPYIQPLQDAQAALTELKGGLTSPRRLQAKRGADWQDVAREIVEDNAMAIELAILRVNELNKKYDAGLHWRELLSLPLGDGVSVSIGAGGDQGAGGAMDQQSGSNGNE